jgi:hypothetical protein
MGGGGKKGGGGGGGGAPDFNIPQGLLQGTAAETGLGQYGMGIMNPLAALTSWASGLAIGQPQNVPTPGAFATQAGPAALHHGTGKEWASQFDPTTGLVTFTNPGNPRQTFQSDLSGAAQNFDFPSQVIQQWQQAHQQYQQYQAGGAGAGLGASMTDPSAAYAPASAAPLVQGVDLPSFQHWFGTNVGHTVFVNGQPRTINKDLSADQALAAYRSGSLSWNAPAGPQLSQAWQDIQAQQAATGQMAGIEAQTQKFLDQAQLEGAKYAQMGDVQEQQAQQLFGLGYQELTEADKQIVDANALVRMTTTGEGLFPAQQKMIEQARLAEETQLASTLGGVGLGRSTQLNQLQGAADLASAATAGQLQQGNIQAAEQVLGGALGQQAGAQKTLGLAQTQGQLAQQSYALQQAVEKLTLSGQQLLAGEQAQLTQELAGISQQSAAFQQQLWTQAMNGYGALGQFLGTSAKSYGYSLSAYSDILKELETHAGIQAGLQEAAMKADAQGNSDLMGGLSSLLGMFGGGGGGGGGLLGGLLGGAGAAAGGAAAAAGGIGAVGSVAGEAIAAVGVAAV